MVYLAGDLFTRRLKNKAPPSRGSMIPDFWLVSNPGLGVDFLAAIIHRGGLDGTLTARMVQRNR